MRLYATGERSLIGSMTDMVRSAQALFVAAAIILGTTITANADALSAALAAHARGNYVTAAQLLFPLAERGSPRAQAMLGFMYATGQGVPQALDAAAYWYRLSAERGDTTGQYLLGLAYDKGQGVPLNDVAAYKWLNLATAHAPNRLRDKYARLRDAVASKMTLGQIAEGQRQALDWPARSPF